MLCPVPAVTDIIIGIHISERIVRVAVLTATGRVAYQNSCKARGAMIDGRIMNSSFLRYLIMQELEEAGVRNACVVLTLPGTTMHEQIASEPHPVNHPHHSIRLSDTSWYVACLSHDVLAGYQLLATACKLNLLCITSATAASLTTFFEEFPRELIEETSVNSIDKQLHKKFMFNPVLRGEYLIARDIFNEEET